MAPCEKIGDGSPVAVSAARVLCRNLGAGAERLDGQAAR